MGLMQMVIPLKQLELVNAPLQQESFAPKVTLNDRPMFDNKLDIRGMSADEALRVIEKFVDHALLANAHSLHILHGKGNAILRTLVKNKLREYGAYISKTYHPAPEQGGDGITMVEM